MHPLHQLLNVTAERAAAGLDARPGAFRERHAAARPLPRIRRSAGGAPATPCSALAANRASCAAVSYSPAPDSAASSNVTIRARARYGA